METDRKEIDPERVAAFVATDRTVRIVAEACREATLHLVGGSVRDLLIGREPTELDFVLEVPVDSIALALDSGARLHREFGTAEATVRGVQVDLARSRGETYREPGALPEVRPADLLTDLERRDFSINAMAFPVDGDGELLDPLGGLADLEDSTLRILHSDSFRDDPTRALRAARYCARLALELDPATLDAVARTDLSTVSEQRVRREIALISTEPDPCASLQLLASWGVLEIDPVALDLSSGAFRIARSEPWLGVCREQDLVEGLLSGAILAESDSLRAVSGDEWDRYLAAASASPAALVLARAAGAEWLDRWPREWAGIELGIGGEDLIEAGIHEGPEIGAGLEAALEDRIRNGDGGRDRELTIAVDEARRVAGA